MILPISSVPTDLILLIDSSKNCAIVGEEDKDKLTKFLVSLSVLSRQR